MSSLNFTDQTTADEVAAAFAEQIKGKTILVTGTSLSGLGFSAARAMAKDAGVLVITGRKLERLREAQAAIEAEFPNANVRPLVLDLASQASVRKAAAEVNAYAEPLDVLVHNAASELGPFALTEDGLEPQFAVAHVNAFLLTKLLLPKLLQSSYRRVVIVSSMAHLRGTVDWESILAPGSDAAREKYSASAGYGQAKVANILFAKELTKRSGGKIEAFSLHPGLIHSGADDHPETKKHLISIGLYTEDGKPNLNAPWPWKTRNQGGATTVAAAFDPSLAGKGGGYLVDSVLANDKASEYALDPANAERLWNITEEILGEKFSFDA